MADVSTFNAEQRDRAGKGVARAHRREGRIPAVIYGNKTEPVMISLDGRELSKHLSQTGFFTRVFEVKVNGDSHEVLARDVQVDPLTDRPLHVDFLRFGADTKIAVEVPCAFLNQDDSPGLKRGGVLNVVRREVELLCSPLNIPQELTFDLTGLDIGDSIHISAIELPDGVTPTVTDRDFTVATIAAPTIQVEEEPEEDEEGLEGEEGEEGLEGEEGAEGEESGGDEEPNGGEE